MLSREKKKDIFASLLLSAVVLAGLVALEIASPRFFSWDDNADQFLPFYSYNYYSLIERHEIPFINYYQYLG